MKYILAPLTHDYAEFHPHPTDPSKIIGQWAEDFSEYEIVVPYQLRDSFLYLLRNAGKFEKVIELISEVK